MAATVFNQAQLELLDMMQWVKSPEVLAELKQVISDFFAKKGQEELDAMYNPQNEMFSHFGTKRYNFKNETQLFKVIPHTSKIQKNRPASPERNTFEGS